MKNTPPRIVLVPSGTLDTAALIKALADAITHGDAADYIRKIAEQGNEKAGGAECK